MNNRQKFFSPNADYVQSEGAISAVVRAAKGVLEQWLKKNKNNINILQDLVNNSLDSDSESFRNLPRNYSARNNEPPEYISLFK